MTELDDFLHAAAAHAGIRVEELLARILHVDDGALDDLVEEMDEGTRALAVRLDREVRLRNPGLHYVKRVMFLGYRREGEAATPAGERSQVFLSIVRAKSRLEVVLPVDPEDLGRHSNVEDLRGKGHHGVGDVRVSLRTDFDVDHFLSDFAHWLTPPAPA